MARKRRLSSSVGGGPSPKRHAKEVIDLNDDSDDEPLEVILARIKEQEQSEALAKRLQAQWHDDGPSSSSSAAGTEPIVIDGDNELPVDSDEALARRLAAEWAAEDAVAPPRAASSRLPLSASNGSSGSLPLPATPLAEESSADAAPNIRLKAYEDLFLATRGCTKCKAAIASPRGYVTYTSGDTLPPPSLVHLLHATCSSCKTIHCRGCFQVLDCAAGCKGKNAPCKALTCCPEIRAIALFEALGGFDRQYLGEQLTSNARSKEAAANYRKNNAASSVGPGGTGYGTGTYPGGSGPAYGPGGSPHRGRGKGRGNGRGRGSQASFRPLSDPVTLAAHWDVVLVRALNTITSLLPAPYSEDVQVYDMLPHPSIAHSLAMSQLPELLATLLRNDSITDWTARSDLYNAMLVLLRRMADCELTLHVLINERYEPASSCGLEEWMWGDGEITWTTSADGTPAKANALYGYFQKLTKQSEAFLAGASQLLEAGAGDDGDAEVETAVQSVSLCGEIIAARDDLERAMKVLAKRPEPVGQSSSHGKGKGRSKGSRPSLTLEQRYAQDCERLAFQHVAFPQVNGDYVSYNYAKELKSTANATRNPKDRLHLVKELAVTATSLPPGVWVRVDEVRNDAVKIMIAGPEGTPYAGGLFEFDCFIPLEYPHKPPLLHLRTTGGGSVRFNPNLYNCGKVCLSLLGTWPGRPEEQWSSKSTLLQVLVSIQSMILVELPYFNEPGYGQARKDDARSGAYNRNVAAQTARWAVVDWLRDEHRGGMWADVVASHFTLREACIRDSLREWAKSEPRIRAYTSAPPVLAPMAGAGFGFMAPLLPSLFVPAPGGMDLFAEFERGMGRVRAWNLHSA